MFVDKTVVEPGYAFIYISNEDPHLVDVYFDDLTITQTKTNVLQYNEYYPFLARRSLGVGGGLQTQNSWTRENTTGNNFLGNGGTELNTTSSLYDLTYRNYDPILGRFGQVDPLADKYGSHTPYNYAFNDPVYFNDPSGDCPYCEHNYEATYASQWSRNPWTGRPARMDDGWNPNFRGPVTMGFIDGKVVYGTPTQVSQAIAELKEAGSIEKNGTGDWGYYESYNGGVDMSSYDKKGWDETTLGSPIIKQRFVKLTNSQYNGGGPGDGRGSATSFSFGFSFFFGMSGEWGKVTDETGNSKWYWSVSANAGLGLDIGFNHKEIIPAEGRRFRIKDYEGRGKNLSFGVGFTSEGRGGNTSTNPTMNPMDFGSLYKERSNTFSPFLGIPAGISDAGVLYQISKTTFFK